MPTTVEIEEERRSEALRFAVHVRYAGKSNEETVKTAELFYAFLTPISQLDVASK